MPDTGWAYPKIEETTKPRDWVAEVAAGSVYDPEMGEGTGLFAPLTDEELVWLEEGKRRRRE
jgi:hypothetical protein